MTHRTVAAIAITPEDDVSAAAMSVFSGRRHVLST
jgi:hypothetical protein